MAGPKVSDFAGSEHHVCSPTFFEIPLTLKLGARRSEILEWISTIPYTSHHRQISDGRLEGTAEWILERGEYRAWRESSVSMLLLLRGIRKSPHAQLGRVLALPARLAGAGKTYIASRVIDSFLSNPVSEKLAFFYCNRAEENRRDPECIMGTLIQQLAQTRSAKDNLLLKPVVDLYKDREERGQKKSRLSLTESQELLIQLTNIHPRTTICIDALDEVDNGIRLRLLKSLRYIVERSGGLIKIFATTRMDTDILLQFDMFPRIELQPDDNVSDINQFVETQVQSVIQEKKLLHGVVPNDLKDEICKVLRERSTGM